MNTDAVSASSLSFSKRLPRFASIGLLAATIFGLARFGIGAVPVWMLAVPFMLLACMDFEGRVRQAESVKGRLGTMAFHFVVVATVVAAHQQIGAGREPARTDAQGGAATFAKLTASGGCGSGGCGAGGSCGSTCGGGDARSRTTVSTAPVPMSRTPSPAPPKGPRTFPGSNPTSTSPGVPPEVLRQIQSRPVVPPGATPASGMGAPGAVKHANGSAPPVQVRGPAPAGEAAAIAVPHPGGLHAPQPPFISAPTPTPNATKP